MTEPTLFRSVDVGVFTAALAQHLRRAGIEVGLAPTVRLGAAIDACPPTDVNTLYWVARTCLLHDHRDIERFDAVFAAVFDDAELPITPGLREAGRASVKATGAVLKHSVPTDGLQTMAGRTSTNRRPEVVDAEDDDTDPADEVELPELLPSNLRELADTPFDQLSPSELEQIGAWFDQQLRNLVMRRSRRTRRGGTSGSVDLRATLRAATSTAGEPLRLERRVARSTPRGIVMVADVSGSMESFTRVYLHLMRSLVTKGDAEVFTFATTLRRVTVPLRDRDPQAAIDRMADEVEDRFSGTQIAASVDQLVRSPVWSHTVRGSTVLVASDGWDAGPPEQLAVAMQRLGRLAHRVVWVNPRSGADGFEPTTGGMAAALPHVDRLLSGHTLRAMQAVLAELTVRPAGAGPASVTRR